MAAAIINYESLVDEPLEDKHYPSRLFEDRSGKFDEYSGAFMMYGLDHERSSKSITDAVCDAIWEMGFDVEGDFFSKVARLSQKLKNSPLVCELKKNHRKLGIEILDSLEDVSRIKSRLINTVDEVVLSKYVPPPPQFILHLAKRINRSMDAKDLVLEACKNLGIEITEDQISRADIVIEKYNCIICEFSNLNVAKKVYNFRDFVSVIPKCVVKSISFYRDHSDYYYDNMLLVSGLNAKRKDCLRLFLEVCEDLEVDVIEDDVARCEWLYGKAFQSKALRSPLVVEFTSEDKRIAVFEASKDELKIRNDLRLSVKPRKPRLPRKRSSEKDAHVEGEEEPVPEEPKVEEEQPVAVSQEPIFRKIYINPFISLPHNMLYTATRDFARRSRRFSCLPMTFYGRIKLQLKEYSEHKEPKEPTDENENENAASATDELVEKLKSLSLDGKTVFIKSPQDLWNLDMKLKTTALDKYYMLTDPYYADVGFALEPYEWFSMNRSNTKRLTRRQLTYDME